LANYEPGVACCSKPVVLTGSNFDAAIKEDPANSFWFLKFYAPWCGHCKRMAPVLDKVASQTLGKMAIGKIDCTVERPLCSQHKVKGYPTLKFALDGVVHDYPGGRTEADLVAFGQKMTRPMVSTVTTLSQALDQAAASESGVIFLAHHPQINSDAAANNGNEAAIDKLLQSQPETQVLAQVARQFRITADFLLLTPPSDSSSSSSSDQDDETISSSTLPEMITKPVLDLVTKKQPFFCRLEPPYVETKCVSDGHEMLTSTAFLGAHVEEQLTPTVSLLGPGNFHAITRKGRSVVIGVVPDAPHTAALDEMKQLLTQVSMAQNPAQVHYFGIIDGGKYNKFLQQFQVTADQLPQLFVLDAPEGEFWQNTTDLYHPPTLPGALLFLQHVNQGLVPAQLTQDAQSGKVWYNRIINTAMFYLVKYRPWSIVVVVLIVVMLAVSVAMVLSPGEEEEGNLIDHGNLTGDLIDNAAAPTEPAATTEEAAATSSESEKESKKDK